jgi:hypothetical protein
MEKRRYKGKSAIYLGDRKVMPGETIEVSDSVAAQLDRCPDWTRWRKKRRKKR